MKKFLFLFALVAFNAGGSLLSAREAEATATAVRASNANFPSFRRGNAAKHFEGVLTMQSHSRQE